MYGPFLMSRPELKHRGSWPSLFVLLHAGHIVGCMACFVRQPLFHSRAPRSARAVTCMLFEYRSLHPTAPCGRDGLEQVGWLAQREQLSGRQPGQIRIVRQSLQQPRDPITGLRYGMSSAHDFPNVHRGRHACFARQQQSARGDLGDPGMVFCRSEAA